MRNMKTKVAFAVWNDRIAPVFDVSEKIHLLEVEDGRVVRETRRVLSGDQPEQRGRALVETGAEVLVCGAISRFLHERITADGIRVVPFVAGTLTDIIRAWLRGDLRRDTYAMPGCCGRKRRGLGFRPESFQEVDHMNGRGSRMGGGGMGRGGGGVGRGGGGMGRGGGPRAAGPGGECVCPKCGHAEPHERGVRCFERTCPKCGSVMTRR